MFVHALDVILRLLHPMIPFLTEEVWQLLGEVVPTRGLPPVAAAESIMRSPWPKVDVQQQDATNEARFARFQAVLGGLREVRSRQNIPPKTSIVFTGSSDAETADLLRPMAPYFASMAGATAAAWGPDVTPPAVSAHTTLPGIDLFVDLTGLIDVAAERARAEKEEARLMQMIAGKQQKLSNEAFVSKAPPEVVAKERTAIAELQDQLASVRKTLDALRTQK
jgi:valyl-tRNA synthetase